MDLNRWGAGGALVKMDGFSSGGNSTLVYFSCEDCSIEENRAAKFGDVFSEIKFPLVSTALSPWFLTPKEICLVYIQWNKRQSPNPSFQRTVCEQSFALLADCPWSLDILGLKYPAGGQGKPLHLSGCRGPS
jgi:hypothetical protein